VEMGASDGFADVPESDPSRAAGTTPGISDPSYEPPFSDDDLEEVDAASDEEVSRVAAKGDEADMEEDFERFAKATSNADETIRQRAFELEQKIHSVDHSNRRKQAFWTSDYYVEIAELIAEQLGCTKGQVIESALLLFFRNCFMDERRMLNDLGLMLDSFTLQTQELGMEVSALEDLANLSIEAESSPLDNSGFPELTEPKQ